MKCPVTGNDLRILESEEIDVLQKKTSQGKLWLADGQQYTGSLQYGLITLNGNYIYPIVNTIVILLEELAIIDNRDNIVKEFFSPDKVQVKEFYDEIGWSANEQGNYKDAVIYEDLREVSKEYLKKCHERVGRQLRPSGKYMLDAASGAVQYPAYLQYSANYTYRVCLDFSFRALAEASKKLGSKGICVLGDMTNMPFKNGVMDGFVSLNTVYHIPKDEQVTAIRELYRVLAKHGKGVVVYDWFKHSPWMNIWMLPFRAAVFLKNRLLDGVSKIAGTKGAERRLYFYAHKPGYFRANLPPYQLKVWRSLSVHFMRYYIHSWLFGKEILEWVYKKEEKEPELCGLKGEYPMLVFEKK